MERLLDLVLTLAGIIIMASQSKAYYIASHGLGGRGGISQGYGCHQIYKSPMDTGVFNRPLTYQPYLYPPDFELALYHQKCSMPGKPDLSQPPCPCCKEHPKKPFGGWWKRTLEIDFKGYGGAIVSYFWLLKLYSISITLVVLIYGCYLQYLTHHYCEELGDLAKRAQVCSKFFGVWLITNSDLHDLIALAGDHDVIVRFSTLRGVVFLILLATGVIALLILKWFNVRYPKKMSISNFSLLFKNLPTDNLEDLISRLRSEFGHFEIKEGFVIKKLEPFYSAYQTKLDYYYSFKIQKDQKKKLKLQRKLEKSARFCKQHEAEFSSLAKRAIIVFHSREVKEKIEEKYRISGLENARLFFSSKYCQERGVYCQQCPMPEEMIWNNLGKEEKEGARVKVKSILYFFGSLALFYLLLFFALQVIYYDQISEPFKSILQFVILLFMTALALTFRQIMNRLSELRFPNTFTQRTQFIVMTTVAFHYIFYLFIPCIYLAIETERRGEVLKLMCGQTLSFVVIHLIFCSVDLIHCLWHRQRKEVENRESPVGCQRLLHAKIQYPRFPIEFKLIVLFKFWSLATFFSFHTPLVLIAVLVALAYHYVKDKFNTYHHFRMEVIHNQVQLNFLRIYTNIFVVFMSIIFIATQHTTFEYVLASLVAAAAFLFQTFYFRTPKRSMHEEEELTAHSQTFDDLPPECLLSYNDRYNQFIEAGTSEKVDELINRELYGTGFSSIEDEDSLGSHLVN